MNQSKLFGRTLRDAPGDAQLASHKLLVRAGFARPLAAGIWTLMPLGLRVSTKLERIIREELDRIGCQEMEMPVLTPASLWQESGRWETLEPVSFRTRDHAGREFLISFTHEEVVAAHAREDVLSYRQLPIMAYHFQSKGRDEPRVRGGLLRVREFVMKDGYSLDRDWEGLDRSFRLHHEAYARIFRRAGVRAILVEAFSGAMGGEVSAEFQVLCDDGEDRLFICERSDYRANAEKATRRIDHRAAPDTVAAMARIATPGVTTIEQLSVFLQEPASHFLKTVLLRANGSVVAAVLPGDRELSETKLGALVSGNIKFANDADFARVGGVAGFVGPMGLRDARILVDSGIARGLPYIAGANVPDAHSRNVVLGRDFDGEVADLHEVRDGDACPRCGSALRLRRGIEVGHIFKLGTFYSERMGAAFLDEDGSRKPFVMGSYGIGLGRLLATVVEEHHDERGICWPMQVAPFHAHVLTLPQSDEAVRAAAERLVADLQQNGIEVLYDDRDESAGVKFADADLIGLPLRVTVSQRTVRANGAELKERSGGEPRVVPLDAVTREVRRTVDAALEAAS
jgi:prolyl-tRNA synthetase